MKLSEWKTNTENEDVAILMKFLSFSKAARHEIE